MESPRTALARRSSSVIAASGRLAGPTSAGGPSATRPRRQPSCRMPAATLQSARTGPRFPPPLPHSASRKSWSCSELRYEIRSRYVRCFVKGLGGVTAAGRPAPEPGQSTGIEESSSLTVDPAPGSRSLDKRKCPRLDSICPSIVQSAPGRSRERRFLTDCSKSNCERSKGRWVLRRAGRFRAGWKRRPSSAQTTPTGVARDRHCLRDGPLAATRPACIVPSIAKVGQGNFHASDLSPAHPPRASAELNPPRAHAGRVPTGSEWPPPSRTSARACPGHSEDPAA